MQKSIKYTNKHLQSNVIFLFFDFKILFFLFFLNVKRVNIRQE